MPIKIPDNLPAVKQMEKENIFVMTTQRASTQAIRPLKILLLNLMPTKIETETQLVRLLGNSPLQVEMELLQTASHTATHVSEQHMIDFYKTFDEVKHNNYDGMIITGAPVERLAFEEVEYWDELCEIMEWTKSHVTSTLHICWGAQAALYYHYGIPKYELPEISSSTSTGGSVFCTVLPLTLQESQPPNVLEMEKIFDVPGAICFAISACGVNSGAITKSSAKTLAASNSAIRIDLSTLTM